MFYTVYGSDDEVAGTAVALASATGLIRSEVGKQTGLKHTPSIAFSRDTVPDTARTIEDLVARAREADAAVAAVRVGAEPAGEADPYRVPADPADDSGDSDPGDEDSWDEDSAGDDLAGDDLAGADLADRGSAADDLAGGRPAGQSGQNEHLAETPASGERGAGYSRS